MGCISLHETLGGESVFDLKIGNRLDLMELSGMNVFENRENLVAWLNLPNHALGNKTPMSLLISRFGMEMVPD